ncbi:MAG: class I SAM-dependent RNA methyltransferase [Roseovarius sp.]
MTEYRITRLGHLGDGVADGPVFVPGALPGEVVTGRLEGDRLEEMRILTPSDLRVSPPCRHFKSCGGCQMQHMRPEALTAWKEEIVNAALEAHGLRPERLLPTAVSPPGSRRRATFSARRTKKGAMAGFHGRRSDVITEIPDCLLLHPGLMPGLEIARALAEAGASRKGALRVAATLSEVGLDIAVEDGKALDGPLQLDLAQIANAHKIARLAWNGETLLTAMPPKQSFDGISVVPPPGAFLQATREGEEALRADVLRIVEGRRHVIDLFAGCGTFALPLARQARVHAVEGAGEMVHALEACWRHGSGLKPLTAETRDLFRQPFVASDLSRFDAAVIDPPRAGAEAQIAELAQSDVPVIVHVSCNPVSFARDAATLVAQGYRLEELRVVDQFLWSSHVELVAAFRRT